MDLVDNSDTGCPVYYRRRHQNKERKAGNIGDWVHRWGGDYGAMVVLDADSIMSAESVVTLSRRLAASRGGTDSDPADHSFAQHPLRPAATVFQSLLWSGLCGGVVLLAWGVIQFLGPQCHHPHGSVCKILPPSDSVRNPPFGGHVLSHDFIEAALLRRAGWGVRFDTDIQASFEQAPPSLIDVLVRDRRWCQGNLQHMRIMFAKGLVLPTRLHLFQGSCLT